eukprot:6172840-Pleurochrysis_carterae.AAC.2
MAGGRWHLACRPCCASGLRRSDMLNSRTTHGRCISLRPRINVCMNTARGTHVNRVAPVLCERSTIG